MKTETLSKIVLVQIITLVVGTIYVLFNGYPF